MRSDGIALSHALWALGSLCALHQKPFSADLLARELPVQSDGTVDTAILLSAGPALGFRVKTVTCSAKSLPKLPLPLLIELQQSDAASTQLGLVTAVAQERCVLFVPGQAEPQQLDLVDLLRQSAGKAWVFAPEVAAPTDEDAAQTGTQSFGFRWFVPEMLRHKKVWRDVLLASLAMQIIALATPLFTQAIIDKVIVHRTQSTLITIGIAMGLFLVLSGLLSWARQYLVLHTGNRVDAVLGAAVWDHLLKLPLRYFEHRPTGVVAARLNAVESIREFVSGAAISLLAQEDSAQNKARADLASAQQILSKLRQTLPIYRQSAEAHEKLLKEGFVGEMTANDKRREWLESEQNLKAQEAAVHSLAAVIEGSERRKAALKSNYRAELENERLEAVTQLNRSAQELDKSTIKTGFFEVKAPTDGVVKDLSVNSPGAVIAAGNVLMNIVPRGEPMQAEVLLSNEDVGFVAAGQKAQVKIAAFPFQKYGLIDGKVALLSPDSADQRQQQQTGQPQLSYRALITMAQQSLRAPGGDTLDLQPGMLVTAEIHQGQRTVLEYLLSPVQKTVKEAARER